MPAADPDNSDASPRELLHLVSTFQTKTDTKWLLQIARYLDGTAFRLSAACFYEGGPVRDQLEALGVRTFNLDMRSEHDPRAIIRVRNLIRELGSEIVHTHLLRADLYGGAAARWAGVPVIVSTAYAIGQYRRERRRRTDPLLDAACAALPRHVVAVAEAVKRDCVERLRMTPDRISVIHTGIDPPPPIDPARPVAFRSKLGIPSDAPLVVTLARLSYEKGIDVLIDTAALLARTHPSARIVVVGDGPDRPALETRIRECGVRETILLAGFCQDVWPAVAAADVACLPSLSEGMPNVLLEAMALGRPIVATTVGGIPEAITDGENGLLVEPKNAEQLAATLARLIDDRSLADRLGTAGRRTVEERFLARDVVARYAALYTSLLAERREAHVGTTATSG